MKPARSANPKAENLVPGHRKNLYPRNTGQTFDKGKREGLTGSNCGWIPFTGT